MLHLSVRYCVDTLCCAKIVMMGAADAGCQPWPAAELAPRPVRVRPAQQSDVPSPLGLRYRRDGVSALWHWEAGLPP